MRVAAIQTQPVLGDVAGNLRAAEPLVERAAAADAQVAVLPEFFTTGMAYLPEIRAGVRRQPGPVLDWMVAQAGRHGIALGGSYLCRDHDGEVRNTFLLVDGDGLIGRHDKDLPTMWENAFYGPGQDPGIIIDRDGLRIGVAMCWEMMRTQTVRRLRGRVDLVLAASAWWSVPLVPPTAVTRRLEQRNARTAALSVRSFGCWVGAPVVHASLCGPLACPGLGFGRRYFGHYEGPTGVYDPTGQTLVERPAASGPGVCITDARPRATASPPDVPDRFWLHRRGAVASLAWTWQGRLGRRERIARSATQAKGPR